MRKIAIFVEGFTEVQFLDQLINEICGKHNVIIDAKKIRGGGKKSGLKKSFSDINASKTPTDEKFYFLIFDCGSDKAVSSEVLAQHQSLTDNGFEKIIAVRDVRPDFSLADIPKLEIYLRKYIKTKLIPVEYILSVMEIEAWFLAETNHLSKIDPNLTIDLIQSTLGFDPSTDDLRLRTNPENDLNDCYGLVGKNYSKSSNQTVAVLDYENIYFHTKLRFNHLNNLISCLDNFVV